MNTNKMATDAQRVKEKQQQKIINFLTDVNYDSRGRYQLTR